MAIRRIACSVLGFALIGAGLQFCFPAHSGAAERRSDESVMWKALRKLPTEVDASPPPNYSGDFVSLAADGVWRGSTQPLAFAQSATPSNEPKPDCSTEAIVHYAQKAPSVFEAGKKGLLYGVKTHTPETRVTARYWDMPGFNSCALVVYAILKQAGCSWAKYTANAREIYDMAYKGGGWRPANKQRAGCMVAWNSRKPGGRDKIGVAQKQAKPGTTAYRHVGITTGAWLSVDNSSLLSRPTSYFTFRPITYSQPIFLCPPEVAAAPAAAGSQNKQP
jgi:hypothetical protein